MSGLGDLFLETGSGLDDFFLASGLRDLLLVSGLSDFFLASGLGDLFGESGLMDFALAGLTALAFSPGLGDLSDGGVGDRPCFGLGLLGSGSGSGTLTCLNGLSDLSRTFLSGVSPSPVSFLLGSGLKDFELDLDRFVAGLLLLERERE